MKVHEMKKSNISKGLSESFSKDIIQCFEILCIEGKQGKFYCTQCQNHAVICAQDFCPCHLNHKKCQNFQNIKALHQNLNSKLLTNFNSDKFLKATHHIADEILKLKNRFQNLFAYLGLSDAQEKIANLMKQSSLGRKIKGQDLKKFIEKRQRQKQYKFEDSLIKFKKILQISKINVLKLFHTLQQQIVKQHIEFFNKKLIQEVLQSDIVQSKQDLKTLNNLINPNLRIQKTQKIFSHYEGTVVNLKDLFKASEGKSPLLFLIENKHGKKFGVYSQCILEKNKITKNQKKQSCLFSIDCNLNQTSDMNKILFHSAYFQGIFEKAREGFTFEMFNNITKSTVSYLKLTPQTCFYNVTNFNQYNINGISQNRQQWGSCPQVRKVQVFKIYFDKVYKTQVKLNAQNEKVRSQQSVLKFSQYGEKNNYNLDKTNNNINNKFNILGNSNTKDEINRKQKSDNYILNNKILGKPESPSSQELKSIFGNVKEDRINNEIDANLKAENKKDEVRELNEETKNLQKNDFKEKLSEEKSIFLNQKLPVIGQKQKSVSSTSLKNSRAIKNKEKIKIQGIPQILLLNEESQQMQDRRIRSKIQYQKSVNDYKKIVTKKINNTIKLTQSVQQDNQINCMAYSNKHGVMITSINQEILLTDINHLQTYFSTQQTDKKSLKKISMTINFSGKVYLSPNESNFLTVNNEELMLFQIPSLNVLSKVKNQQKLRHFAFVDNQIFVGWNFHSQAYLYIFSLFGIKTLRKLEEIKNCISINVINQHIVVCEKINLSQEDQDTKIIVYDKNGQNVKNEISLREFGNPDMYLFDFTQVISVFPIKQEKQGQFSPNDIYGLVLAYYDDFQQQPERRYLCFLKGDLLTKKSQIQIRGFQLFLSPSQDRTFYYNQKQQKIPFQVQIATTGQTKIIMIQRLQNVFFVDCTKEFSKLKLQMEEKQSFQMQYGQYFKGMCLMRNMLEIQRRLPVKDSNEICSMICRQFDGEFLSLYFPAKQTELTVPFPASVLLLGENKIMRRYVVELQQAVQQYEVDQLKNVLENLQVQSYVQKVKSPVKIQPGEVNTLQNEQSKAGAKQENEIRPLSIFGNKRIPNKKPSQSTNYQNLFGVLKRNSERQSNSNLFVQESLFSKQKQQLQTPSLFGSINTQSIIPNTHPSLFSNKPKMFGVNLFSNKLS